MATVTDIDGNVYTTVIIGTQAWLVENLKTTKYNDGAAIPLVTDTSAWGALTTPGYCWYNNDIGYKTPYGALYNWYAVGTGKLAPAGWRVPTETDWATLISFIGGGSVAGGKLKEVGTAHWSSPNTGATNETGFTAVPGGGRISIFGGYAFINMPWWNYLWSSTAYAYPPGAYSYGITTNNAAISYGPYYLKSGLSVRCMRPIPDFSAVPVSGASPLAVTFTDLSTGATSWLWDFGDGETSVLQNPSHTYATSGTYTVNLTIDGINTETKLDYITANFTVRFTGTPQNGKKPLKVQFTDLSV